MTASARAGRRRRILLINSNTTQAVTDRMLAMAQAMTDNGPEWIGQTARFGARYISDRAAFAIAGHATLDAYALHRGTVDAVLIGCFGDPALLALRDLAGVPVIGLAEASFTAAAADGTRFAIVTGGRRWEPMLGELVRELGHERACAGIRTVDLTGGQIAADPDAAVGMLTQASIRAARETGADRIILGGAGLAGLADSIAALLPVPVICSVRAGLQAAVTQAEQGPCSRDTPPQATTGLSPELALLMGG